MEIDWSKALRYAKLVQLTEQVPIQGCEAVLAQKVKDAGGIFFEPIYGREWAHYFNSELGPRALFGFIAKFPNAEIVICLRCTETFAEVVHDLSFLSVPNPIPNGRGWVASGFASLYNSLTGGDGETKLKDALKKHLDPKKLQTITIVGHSLGGPLSTLLALDVAMNLKVKNPAVYTFGSPRTGGKMFAEQFAVEISESYRVVCKYDAVQVVPILPAYYHIDTRYVLDPPPKTIKMDLLCMHHISTYIYLIEQLIGKGKDPLDEDCKWCTWWERIKGWFK